jgi:hypothetical protein
VKEKAVRSPVGGLGKTCYTPSYFEEPEEEEDVGALEDGGRYRRGVRARG